MEPWRRGTRAAPGEGSRLRPGKGAGCARGRERAPPGEGSGLRPGKGAGCARRRTRASLAARLFGEPARPPSGLAGGCAPCTPPRIAGRRARCALDRWYSRRERGFRRRVACGDGRPSWPPRIALRAGALDPGSRLRRQKDAGCSFADRPTGGGPRPGFLGDPPARPRDCQGAASPAPRLGSPGRAQGVLSTDGFLREDYEPLPRSDRRGTEAASVLGGVGVTTLIRGGRSLRVVRAARRPGWAPARSVTRAASACESGAPGVAFTGSSQSGV
jgi:hypothetical protein